MKTLNIPKHIIFGAKLPLIEMIIEGSRQYMFSMNNYNLYREDSDLNGRGTFTIGSLFKMARNCPYCLMNTSVILPECETTCEPCSLLAEKYEELYTASDRVPGGSSKLRKVRLHKVPHLYECEVLSALLGCTTTPAEKKFAEAYYNLAISWMDFPEDAMFCLRDLRETYENFLQSCYGNQPQLSPEAKEPREVVGAILDSIVAPALIPQVWFNCSSAEERQNENEMKAPKCVDFILIFENKLHVVEIDSLSRYLRLGSSAKWVVDEETFTDTLRVDRYLCSRGYVVHRFSEWEIINASESELIDFLSDVLGLMPRHFKPKLLTSC